MNESGQAVLFVAIALGLLLAMGIVFGILKVRASRALGLQSEKVRSLVDEGRFERAGQALAELSKSLGLWCLFIKKPLLAAFQHGLRAKLALRQSDSAVARAEADSLWKLRHKLVGIADMAASEIALQLLLEGELDEADSWLERAAGDNLFIKLLLQARRGDHSYARSSQNALLMGLTTDEHGRRVMHLLFAFGQQRLGLENDTFEKHLTQALPSFSGEYDYLCANWPELATFVRTKASAS